MLHSRSSVGETMDYMFFKLVLGDTSASLKHFEDA